MFVFCKILNYLAIISLTLSFIGNFLTFWLFWNFVLNGIFKVFLVVILLATEIKQSPSMVKPLSFLFSFGGRGLFYIFLGCMTIGLDILSLIGNFILVAIGIVYLFLSLSHTGKEPQYMSFKHYQRLTGGMSHEPPAATTASNQQGSYPVAHQTPLAQTSQQQQSTSNVQSVDDSLPEGKTEV